MTAPPDDLTKFLAAYGALLASIGLGWNLYRDLHDRAQLKISATISRLTVDGQGNWLAITSAVKAPGTKQRYVVLTAVNVGRRPLVWTGWGGKYKKRTEPTQFGILDRGIHNHLPKKLQEGDTHSACTELEDGFLEGVKSLFIWDASGKQWKLSRWQLRKLTTEARKQE